MHEKFQPNKDPQFPNPEKDLRKEKRERLIENTTLVIPQNDGESIMIGKIAEHFGIETRMIEGSWDLPEEEKLKQLRALSEFKSNIAVVELHAQDVEKEWVKNLESEANLKIIDHHVYRLEDGTVLDRVEDNGSSLDQFLKHFGLDDEKLFEDFEYDWRFIQGVSINDKAFITGLLGAGYSREEIEAIRAFDRAGQYGEKKDEIELANREAFERKTMIGENIYVIDFGEERVNYTFAKDLAIFEHLSKDSKEKGEGSLTTFIIRPSKAEIMEKSGVPMWDLAIEVLGSEPRLKEIMKNLNEIQLDKRGRPHNHWWKADVDEETLKQVRAYMQTLAE